MYQLNARFSPRQDILFLGSQETPSSTKRVRVMQIRCLLWVLVQSECSPTLYPLCVFLDVPKARTCMSSALRDVLCACYESGGTDEATGSQLAPKMQVWRLFPSPHVWVAFCTRLPLKKGSYPRSVKHAAHGFQGPHVDTAFLRPHHTLCLDRHLSRRLAPSRSSLSHESRLAWNAALRRRPSSRARVPGTTKITICSRSRSHRRRCVVYGSL